MIHCFNHHTMNVVDQSILVSFLSTVSNISSGSPFNVYTFSICLVLQYILLKCNITLARVNQLRVLKITRHGSCFACEHSWCEVRNECSQERRVPHPWFLHIHTSATLNLSDTVCNHLPHASNSHVVSAIKTKSISRQHRG